MYKESYKKYEHLMQDGDNFLTKDLIHPPFDSYNKKAWQLLEYRNFNSFQLTNHWSVSDVVYVKMKLNLEAVWCALTATVSMCFVKAVLKVGSRITTHVPTVGTGLNESFV